MFKPLIDSYSAVLRRFKGNEIVATINEEVNIERLRTMYSGYEGDRIIEVRFIDPRRFTVQQRKFIFNLLRDISMHFGEPIKSQKEYFYAEFEGETGRTISLKDTSSTTISDANILINLILDYIFENHIPFKNGYDILPVNQEYYFYKCIVNRVCCICGKTGAEIDHFDQALGRRKRKKVDHTEYTFAALCNGHQSIQEIERELMIDGVNGLDTEKVREIVKRGGHHAEKHLIGITAFKQKYHVKGIKLNQETIKKLNIGG
ncbi:putative HNHc nuclease [Enterococcus faecium]